MNFGESIATCMGKYATFSGRATRSEYWWFYLFTGLLNLGATLVAAATFGAGDPAVELMSSLMNLAVFVPVLAAGSRRLHDIGKSGWWQLLMVTIIGVIPLIIWLATDTKLEGNKFNSVDSKPEESAA